MDTRIAVITGANRGLGRSMAIHLARQGVDVVGTFHTNEAEAAELAREIEALGRRVAMLRLDVAQAATFPAFADVLRQTLESTFGRPTFDYLVNNAGIAGYTPIADITETEFDNLTNVHFKGPVFLTKALLPSIVDGGRIINISSGLTRITHPGPAIYAANKGAIEVFTRYLAKDLGPRRITVNVIAPGVIATDFGGGRIRNNPEIAKQIASTIALGRVGVADDVGGAVAALLSDETGWINGQRIEVSGGQSL
jgi:NAD(P)-dependent dehydrogenase (short-subunit alcohol dehydrogenase family)